MKKEQAIHHKIPNALSYAFTLQNVQNILIFKTASSKSLKVTAPLISLPLITRQFKY